MTSAYDVVVVGGGPGGYVAAIRAAQLGLKTACVEKRATLGGTCLNIGCIPSKALLQSSERYLAAREHFGEHGIKLDGVSLDLAAMLARKDKVVEQTTKGIEFLFKKNKIDWIHGTATLAAPNALNVSNGADPQSLEARAIILATGSEVTPLPGTAIDERVIVSSTGALALPEVPKHLVVIGGGYIGLELGSVWRRLGAEVTVIEFLDRITPTMDQEIAKLLQRALQKEGLKFKLGTKVTQVERTNAGARLTLEPAAGGASETVDCDVVLVSIGRRPYTNGLGLDRVGVTLDAKGRIATEGGYRTNVAGIYAIGDVIDGPMLAHKASEEGVAVAELIAGQHGHVNYRAIPAVIYTAPEVASVGATEEELKAGGASYKVGKFPFTANARARANGDTDGMVKVLSDARTDQLLGVHVIGHEAGEMIGELALAMEFGASAEDVGRTCHPHPTLSEAIKEAALAAYDKPIHI